MSNTIRPEWRQLKSGTDVRGVALHGAGKTVTLTEDVAARLGLALVRFLAEKEGCAAEHLRIGAGRDSRLSGESLLAAFCRGVGAGGASAFDVGMATTPAMFFSTVAEPFAFDGAVMVTASHLPYERNGFKFFTRDGGLSGDDILTLLAVAQESEGPSHSRAPEKVDVLPCYAASLREMIIRGANKGERPLAGLHVAVDAGNGMGGFFVEHVLQPLGADTSGSQFLEPDGRFPHHVPNPEDEKMMASLRQAVGAHHADFGAAFDTDVDRAGAMAANGREINRNALIALLAVIALETCPGGVIVTDSTTSSALPGFIAAHGGKHLRFKRGYQNVIGKMKALNDEGIPCPLAIETSGHAAFAENHNLDDGAYLIAKLLVLLAKEGKDALLARIVSLKEPAESVELRFPIVEGDFLSCGQRVLDRLAAYARQARWRLAEDNYEGVRIEFEGDKEQGWLLLRLSLHDPVLPLNIESDMAGGAARIGAMLREALDGVEGIDIAPLHAFLAR